MIFAPYAYFFIPLQIFLLLAIGIHFGQIFVILHVPVHFGLFIIASQFVFPLLRYKGNIDECS
jgi:hypothetical protein